MAAKADASALTAKANTADVYAKTATYSKTEVDTALTGKANTVHTHTIANVTGLQTALDGKADDADLTAKANTVDVYPKTATYSKTEVDTALTGKADAAALAAKANTADLAAKADTADLAAKANSADVYLKTETYNKTEVDTDLAAKSNVGHTHNFLDLANQPDAYTPTAHQHPISDVTGLQPALDAKADDTDLAGKADLIHTHDFAAITGKPTTFTPPLASGLVVGGHRVGNGLAMAGEYLTVKSGNGLKTDNATSYAVEIDKTVTDGWYATASQMGGLTIWKGTQSAYDALTKDPNTLYFITGA